MSLLQCSLQEAGRGAAGGQEHGAGDGRSMEPMPSRAGVQSFGWGLWDEAGWGV